jgi:hypothetical protein
VPRVLDGIVLLSHGFLGCVRGVAEWALKVIGFWQLLLGFCLLHGLYIVKCAIARVCDVCFNTSFFTSWVFSGMESCAWRLIRSYVPSLGLGWFTPPWAQPMLVDSSVGTVATVMSDSVSMPPSRMGFLEDLASPRVAMLVVFVMRIGAAYRRG